MSLLFSFRAVGRTRRFNHRRRSASVKYNNWGPDLLRARRSHRQWQKNANMVCELALANSIGGLRICGEGRCARIVANPSLKTSHQQVRLCVYVEPLAKFAFSPTAVALQPFALISLSMDRINEFKTGEQSFFS